MTRLRRRGVHRRRGRHPPAVLHQPRRAGVRPGQPARGGEGRAVRPLLPLAQEPAPAVPRRVRRRPRHHRRPDHRRHRRPAAGRGALRPGLLRVRRRLGGPARRRAPGLRAGLEPAHQGARVGPAHGVPRAVDPLHRLRRPHRRPLPLLPRPRGAGSPASAPATSATWTACSTPTPSWPPRWATSSGSRFPKDPDDSDFVYRQAIRAKAFDALRGDPARGLAVQRRHLRHGPGLRGSCCCACGPTRCPRPAPTPT